MLHIDKEFNISGQIVIMFEWEMKWLTVEDMLQCIPGIIHMVGTWLLLATSSPGCIF